MPVKNGAINVCYAQSGGVTAVINAAAAAAEKAVRADKRLGRFYAGQNGILGVLQEELIETWRAPVGIWQKLRHTPGGTFGSCRIKLPPHTKDRAIYERLFAVFRAHNIGVFLYNGGNDSADTALKITRAAKALCAPLTVTAIAKTIDNDLAMTDTCPGFGSAAKYIATTVAETTLDLAAMAATSTKVFVLEVMGRHAGWLAAAGGLAAADDSRHLILFPEKPFIRASFINALQKKVHNAGYAVVVVSEGVRDKRGAFLSAGGSDAFAHRQLGGAAPVLAEMIRLDAKVKCHWAVADYAQRSARHLASTTDLLQTEALAAAAVRYAADGKSGIMPVLHRLSDTPYRWKVIPAPLAKVANKERAMPPSFISKDGYFITTKCRRYLAPLIKGEDYPPYVNGMPKYATPQWQQTTKRLPPYQYQS
ncbi:MAG: 6-phosphofructokinase [Gammaproteobacteria bacterium]